MSQWYDKTYEERREERREEERKYQAEVSYDVWRSGGNPDSVDRDRVSENFGSGVDSESATRIELRAQAPKHHHEEECQQEEQWPEEQQQ
jgi:hypothetical protein